MKGPYAMLMLTLELATLVETSLACERRRIFGCRFSPPNAEKNDSRKYVCVRRLKQALTAVALQKTRLHVWFNSNCSSNHQQIKLADNDKFF